MERPPHNEPLPAELNSPRVLVFLTVPWSRNEILSRKVFDAAIDVLTDSHAELGIGTVVLDEDSEVIQQWIHSLSIPFFEGKGAYGAGTVLWLADGAFVDIDRYPGAADGSRLVERTLKLWGGKSGGGEE